MIRDAIAKHLCEMFAHGLLLVLPQLQWIRDGKLTRKFTGQCFGGLPARSEDEDRPQVLGQSFGNEARPIATNVARHMIIQVVRIDFIEGDRAMVMAEYSGRDVKSGADPRPRARRSLLKEM